MKAKNRQQKLLELLKHNVEYTTVKKLSEQLLVSQRTIHNDIVLLEKQGIIFDKKPSVGISVLSEKTEMKKDLDSYSPYNRRLSIIKELLFKGETITYLKASEKYMVSISSIIADINFIKDNILNESTLILTADEVGTRFIGNEEEWQKTFVAFNEYLLKDINFYFSEENLITLLSQYYEVEDIKTSFKIINSFKNYNLSSIGEYYLLNVFNVILVLLYRLKKGRHHSSKQNLLDADRIKLLMNYMVAKDILELIKEEAPILYTDEDIYYLSVYLTANRITFIASGIYLDDSISSIVTNMIGRLSSCVNVDLHDDIELFRNVSAHLTAMIYRLQNKIMLHNPMLDEIKQEYKLLFEMTWLITDSLKEKKSITLNEHEIGFLMLHFQNALEKKKKSKRVLVVCPYGIATSGLIANKIARILPPLDIIEVASIREVNSFDLKGIDFIISTTPLDIKNKPVVVVSILLTDNDIQNIELVYKNYKFMKTEESSSGKRVLNKYLPEKYIFINEGTITKEKIVKNVCEQLVKDGVVSSTYEESVLEREKKGGTDIISRGAIPHGATNHVFKTRLVVWINKEPIKWSKYKVKLIVFFVLCEKDIKYSKKILEEAFSLIKSKEYIDEISSLNSKEDVITHIYGGK